MLNMWVSSLAQAVREVKEGLLNVDLLEISALFPSDLQLDIF